jgi:multiple sugar transport system substrate-binding protein
MKHQSPLGRHAKTVLSAVGVAAVLATSVAACGPSSSSAGDKPKTLQMWVPPTMSDTGDSDVAVWKDLLKPWEQKNGVKVNVTIVSWASYEAKMLTGTSSGAGPDVTYMYNEMVGDYVKRGQLIALDQYLTSDDKANFLYLDKGKIAGKQYMMPYIVGGARVLFYNKDVLAKAGVTTPPATWSDFEQAAVKIKSAGFTPFLQQWGDPNRSMMNEMFYPFLWQAGGEIFNDSGTATAFNSPAGIKAAQFLYSMKKNGLMPSSVTGLNEAQVRSQFTSGKVGFLMDSDATLPMFAKSKMNLGVIDSLADQRQGTFLAVDSLVVPKQCPDPELCMSLVKFIESGPVMTQIHTHAPFNPIAKDEKYAGQPQFAELYKNPAILHNLPVATNSVQAYNILYKNLQQMMLGQKSPEQALADAASEGDAALKQG